MPEAASMIEPPTAGLHGVNVSLLDAPMPPWLAEAHKV